MAFVVEQFGVQGFSQNGEFAGLRRAGGSEAEAVVEASGGRLAAFEQHALGEGAGGFHICGVVEQHEGLQRGVGDGAAGGAFLAVRRVEGGHLGRGRGAFPEGVKATAMQVIAVALLVRL